MLGQIGLPGGGFGHGYGSMGDVGQPRAGCCGCRPSARAATRCAPSSRWPGSPTCCCNPGGQLRLQRPAATPTPTSGWSTGRAATRSTTTRTWAGCARAFGPPGHDRRARAVLDGHRPARRHRAPGHHQPGARRHRRRAPGHAPDRHAPRDRRRSAQARDDYDDLRRAGRAAGPAAGLHRGPDARASGSSTSTAPGASRCSADGHDVPDFAEFWAAGERRLPERPGARHAVRAVPRRPGRVAAAHAERADRDHLRRHRGLRLRRLPRAPGLAGAARVAGRPAGAAFPAAPDRQPAGHPAAQPARRGRDQPARQGRRAASRAHAPRATPRPAASATATWSGSSTTAAPAWPARC